MAMKRNRETCRQKYRQTYLLTGERAFRNLYSWRTYSIPHVTSAALGWV